MAWVALVAVLAHLLAPIIASAGMAAGSGPHRVEVCTAAGSAILMIADEGDGSGSEPTPVSGSGRCMLCLTACVIAPPPEAGQAHCAPRQAGSEPTPVRSDAAARHLFDWALTQPRAPPPA